MHLHFITSKAATRDGHVTLFPSIRALPPSNLVWHVLVSGDSGHSRPARCRARLNDCVPIASGKAKELLTCHPQSRRLAMLPVMAAKSGVCTLHGWNKSVMPFGEYTRSYLISICRTHNRQAQNPFFPTSSLKFTEAQPCQNVRPGFWTLGTKSTTIFASTQLQPRMTEIRTSPPNPAIGDRKRLLR